jgi:hypothetical protein
VVIEVEYFLSKFPKSIYWAILGYEKKCCPTNAKQNKNNFKIKKWSKEI